MYTVRYCRDYDQSRLDPAFYTDRNPEWVATVEYQDRLLEAWVVGDMYIYSEDDSTIRYASDLLERGITTDAELKAFEGEWWNNSWIELRDYEGEWISDVFLGTVYHDIFEAVENMKVLLIDEEFISEHPCKNPDYVLESTNR
jgi:hypothetical protein